MSWLDHTMDEALGRVSVLKVREQILRANAVAPAGDVQTIAEKTAEKKAAMEVVTVDGTGIDQFSPSLRAVAGTLAADTERHLRDTGAIPLSEIEQRKIAAIKKYRMGAEYQMQAMAAPAYTLAQIAGDRVRVAYRLVRQLALIKGDIKLGRLLVQDLSAGGVALSKWEFPMPFMPGKGIFRGYKHVIDLLMSLNENPAIYTYHGNNCKPIYTFGVSYLPVPVSDEAYSDKNPLYLAEMRKYGQIPEDYDTYDDYGLMTQLFVYQQIADALGMGAGDPKEMAALGALLNPNIARLAWPTQDDLEMYEEQLLYPWIYDILTEFSYQTVVTRLQQEYRLTYLEAMDFVECGKHFVRHVAKFAKDVEKGVMLSRTDRLMEYCIKEGLVSTALNTMKLKMQATGLTTPGEDLHEDRQIALSSGLREKIKKHEGPEKQLPEPQAERTQS